MDIKLQRQYFTVVKTDREPNIPKIPKNSEYYFGNTNAHIEVPDDEDEFYGSNFQEKKKLDHETAALFTSEFWREVYEELNERADVKIKNYDGEMRITKVKNLDQLCDGYKETSLNGYDDFKPSWKMMTGYRGCNQILGPKNLKEALVSVILLRAHYYDVFSMYLPTASMSETEFNSWDELWTYAFYHCNSDCPHCVTPYNISEKFEGKPRAVAVINNNRIRMTFSERAPGSIRIFYWRNETEFPTKIQFDLNAN